MSAAMNQCSGDIDAALELAAETVALAHDNSMPYWIAWGSVLEGWALARRGDPYTGIKTLEFGLHAYRETGAELFRAYSLSLLAEACRIAGRREEAIDHLEQALVSAREQGAHFYTAEIHRLRGDIALELGRGADTAVEAYRESLAIAKSQGAAAFELRAAVGLAELLVGAGKRAEALDVIGTLRLRAESDTSSPDARRLMEIASRAKSQVDST
jgi:predicted ATPase